jgi:2C-methyl-D-erythritol 2,4-cyclodiphosphate synthase
MTEVSHAPYFSLFLRLKKKLRDRHSDTTVVIEAESQAVSNTLTERDFQDAFRKLQKRWEQCIRTERKYFEGDGGQ